jgi:hypothetical protein
MPARHRARGLAAAFLAAAALAAGAAPAAARDHVLTLKGADAPGPARLDTVKVLQMGPKSATHVLVLEPGTSAGAPYFRPIAHDILARLRGWQIWSVERRENGLEDHSVLRRALERKLSVQRLFDYYLGWIGRTSPGRHFEPVTDASAAYVKRWGLAVAMADLHRVIAAARRGGRTVVLGGHSLGGAMTTAYATWDFGGRAGARNLAGLVFIDGAGGSSRRRLPTAAQARRSLADLNASSASPFLTLVLGPWEAGVFNAVGSAAARLAPRAPSVLGAWGLLPGILRTPGPATNRGGYGYAVDTQTSPESLALVQMHIGRLAGSGSPRDWVDGELGTVERAAQVFSGIPAMDGSSWYHPLRLSIDAGALDNRIRNSAQRVLGDRTTHGRDVHLPMYAIETSLGAGHVLRSVRALARRSRVPRRKLVLVDRHTSMAHIDPLVDIPRRNAFLKTVVPFLKRIR